MRRRMNLLVSLLLSALLLAPMHAARADYVEVGRVELLELLDSGATIVDVRRADEWQRTGVIDNSHRMTFFDHFGRFDAERWLARLATVTSPEQPLILICETGARSRVIGYWLKYRLGFARIYNVRDGIADWITAGLPVVPIAD